ncbi:hypothetical protein KUTeg_011109 [Tegillarca granosa]|uniref:Uncharacterized protein n=1 Tax=Tegillarca granosa TaxID=220873 RepID=A0ABQ9F2X3_TEGGR|nr:hypothetical protein KUTeg_011109 [Tegillarca granosa]
MSQDVYFGGEANNMGIAGVNKLGVLMKDKSTLTDPKMAQPHSLCTRNCANSELKDAKIRKVFMICNTIVLPHSLTNVVSNTIILWVKGRSETMPVKQEQMLCTINNFPNFTYQQGRSETMPVAGVNDEEGRVPSAKSRASLRSQYRNKLEEARSAAEDRRSKSPAISVPSVRSLEEDQLVEEEDDEDIPVTDEFKVDIKEKEKEITMDVGTSPPPTKEQRRSVSLSRQSLAIADHPAVLEYLKIYDGLVNFRDALSKIMVDKEMLQFGQILADLDTVKFEKEAQDTINELQRELAALGRASSRMRQISDNGPGQVPESAVMFTRLDSERNSKIMKRAVNDDKLDPEKYKDAVNKMDDYVSLPAQRLAHLVRKYVHHCRMKEIEENVKKSKSLNENVFEILDKMEALQNQRAKKWADKMDEMGSERLRLASLLMETLDSIEQESGIFLIKPMYSYRSRDMVKERYAGKLSRPNRPRTNQSPARDIPSAYAPAPTPASNARVKFIPSERGFRYTWSKFIKYSKNPRTGYKQDADWSKYYQLQVTAAGVDRRQTCECITEQLTIICHRAKDSVPPSSPAQYSPTGSAQKRNKQVRQGLHYDILQQQMLKSLANVKIGKFCNRKRETEL